MAPRPVSIMWERYLKEALPRFEPDEPATMLARAAFFSGIAMAVAYFKEAGEGTPDEFAQRMDALEDELDEAALNAWPVATDQPQ